jgi:hypothetical protein
MTNRDGERSGNGEGDGHFYIIFEEEMERLIAALTVIQGYAQLVRRRIEETPTSRREDLEPGLARIDTGARAMSEEFRVIMGLTPRSGNDPDPQ